MHFMNSVVLLNAIIPTVLSKKLNDFNKLHIFIFCVYGLSYNFQFMMNKMGFMGATFCSPRDSSLVSSS